MNKLEELSVKINADQEVLSTFPQNNTKNKKIYYERVNEVKEEYDTYKEAILNEMESRYKQAIKVSEDNEIAEIRQKIENIENYLYILSDINTSFEKMQFDQKLQNLRYYYKKELTMVNDTIFYCIKKFSEIGVEIKLEDFYYSKYVKEYLKLFFEEMDTSNIHSDKIHTKFEEIYWKCPDIILHIELNFRYIYLRNEKEINKYYEKQKDALLKRRNIQAVEDEYVELRKKYIKKVNEDKYGLVNKFITRELKSEDYAKSKIDNIYTHLIEPEIIENADEEKLNEISLNMEKLLHSIYEYKNYLKFQFIVEDIKRIYQEKDKHKNTYEQKKKEIIRLENTIFKLNNKAQGKGMFKKPDESVLIKQNALILEAKDLYRNLENSRIYHNICIGLKDSSTIRDVLHYVSLFYNYIWRCTRNEYDDIGEDEIVQMIEDLIEFMKWPYCNILNNIDILEEKNILLIIKDRYKLLGINLGAEELAEDSLEQLEAEMKKVVLDYNIRKNKIDIEELGYIAEFKEILNI